MVKNTQKTSKKKITIYIDKNFDDILSYIKQRRWHLSKNDIVKNALLIYYEYLKAIEEGKDPCEAIRGGDF